MRKYAIIDTFINGYRLVSLKELKKNPILLSHPILAVGTKRYLKRVGWIK